MSNQEHNLYTLPNNLNKVGKYVKSINSAAPLSYTMGNGVMGSFDSLELRTPCGPGNWRHPPCNPGLKKGPLFVPQGTPLPLAGETVYATLPTDSMFMFANNYSSPECCPSTFSSDMGCVCTTPQQRKLVGQQRGNNKNFNNYGF